MKVGLQALLNDSNVDANQNNTQRQLSLSISALSDQSDRNVPINLCLILDHSGSMHGQPLETVKKAAISLLEKLNPSDRLSVVAFDHRAKVLVENQYVDNIDKVKQKIAELKADGGTAIDEGMKLGIEEVYKGRSDRVSQIFLLTDGENEHGDNKKCLKHAHTASEHNITFSTLGFGEHWNQDVLEKIADSAGGALTYIEKPEDALKVFGKLFKRIQSVGLTNAYLIFDLMPEIRLAELKPIAQVAPDTIELPYQRENNKIVVRVGDLMTDDSRVILANLYLNRLPAGKQPIANLQVRYDDPAMGLESELSESVTVYADVQQVYQAQPNPEVQKSILALAKYRQTQIAEQKLQQGDQIGAATMLQTAAKTALQMGDKGAATVLQTSATRLQEGQNLSEAERKKTRIVSKTVLQE
jgi:Ca-activated chloride channel family protein